jgi:pimeloyl-ACP methyl ester carboxylesterase
MTIDDWASDLLAIANELELDKIVLWSASTGALVNTRFAALAPERVRALIMYPEVTFALENRMRLRFYGEVVRHFGWKGLGAIFALFLPDAIQGTPSAAEFVAWETRIMEEYFTLESFQRAIETVSEADVLASIHRLENHPILLLAGDSGLLGADGEAFKSRAAAIKKLAPRTTVKVIAESGGTYSMLEQPDASVAAIVEFLKDADEPGGVRR